MLLYNSKANTLGNASMIMAWLAHVMKNHSVTRKVKSRVHWWTQELASLQKEIKKLRRRVHKKPSEEITKKIRQLRDELRLKIKKEKREA